MSFFSYICNCVALDTGMCGLLGDIDSVYKAKYSRFEIGYSVGEYPPDHSNNGEFFRQRAYCTGSTRNVVILPDGRVTICEELYAHPTFIIGDLKFQTLEEVWKSSRALDLFYMQKESVQGSSPCKNCCTFHECREGKGVCRKTILWLMVSTIGHFLILCVQKHQNNIKNIG